MRILDGLDELFAEKGARIFSGGSRGEVSRSFVTTPPVVPGVLAGKAGVPQLLFVLAATNSEVMFTANGGVQFDHVPQDPDEVFKKLHRCFEEALEEFVSGSRFYQLKDKTSTTITVENVCSRHTTAITACLGDQFGFLQVLPGVYTGSMIGDRLMTTIVGCHFSKSDLVVHLMGILFGSLIGPDLVRTLFAWYEVHAHRQCFKWWGIGRHHMIDLTHDYGSLPVLVLYLFLAWLEAVLLSKTGGATRKSEFNDRAIQNMTEGIDSVFTDEAARSLPFATILKRIRFIIGAIPSPDNLGKIDDQARVFVQLAEKIEQGLFQTWSLKLHPALPSAARESIQTALLCIKRLSSDCTPVERRCPPLPTEIVLTILEYLEIADLQAIRV